MTTTPKTRAMVTVANQEGDRIGRSMIAFDVLPRIGDKLHYLGDDLVATVNNVYHEVDEHRISQGIAIYCTVEKGDD